MKWLTYGMAAMALAAILFFACSKPYVSQAQQPGPTPEKVGLTIYSRNQQVTYNPYYYDPYGYQQYNAQAQVPGYGVVKEWRKIHLAKGRNTIRFQDVAQSIDATTVHFKSATDPEGTSVVEQNFEYDLVNADKILSKYIDRNITLVLKEGKEVTGSLQSFDANQVVLRIEGASEPIQIIARGENVRNIKFSALPGGLIAKPTLVWLVDAAKPGDHSANVTYQTSGVDWSADYTAVTAKDDKQIDLSGWVTVKNQTGTMYKDAEIKLVAGDVHRITAPAVVGGAVTRGALMDAAKVAPPQFVEKPFFEYHLYTMQRPTTLPNNSIKQIELFNPVDKVPAKKIFLYYGGVGAWSYGGAPYQDRNYGITSNTKVDIYMEFKNGKENGLGIPLPAGRVRVYKKDEADSASEFIGEDRIDHTPKDEKVLLKLGSAFDIVGERKQTDYQVGHHWLRESFEIRLRNHKEEAVEVIVKENLYRWSNWKIEKSSHKYEKKEGRTIHFPVKVAKDGETVVTYTVLYTW